jgi:hypothetical protein
MGAKTTGLSKVKYLSPFFAISRNWSLGRKPLAFGRQRRP